MIVEEYPEGAKVPWHLGFCWWNSDFRTATYVPIPLNWVMAWGRTLWFYLMHGPRDKLMVRYGKAAKREHKRVYEIGYALGYKRGREDEQKRWDDAFNKWLVERAERRQELEQEIEHE